MIVAIVMAMLAPACGAADGPEQTQFLRSPVQIDTMEWTGTSFVLWYRRVFLYSDDGQVIGMRGLNPQSDGDLLPQWQISWTYDEANRLASWEDQNFVAATMTWVPDTRRLYTYDADGRLNEVVGEGYENGAWTHVYTERYEYDDSRLARSWKAVPGELRGMTSSMSSFTPTVGPSSPMRA